MSNSAGRRRTSPRPPAKIIGLLPIWALIQPVRGMAMIDPTPRQKKIRPSSPSPTPTFALAKGTRGAKQAMRKPAAKKDRRVARRVLAVSAKLAGREVMSGDSFFQAIAKR